MLSQLDLSMKFYSYSHFCSTNEIFVLKAVKSETSGKFEFGLLTILKCAENPAKYFAKVCLVLFIFLLLVRPFSLV